MLNDTGIWRLSILSRMEAKGIKIRSSQRFVHASFNYHLIKQCSSYYLSLTELVENAIDVGASNTEITLENEGFEKIVAKNNGKGIRRQHLPYIWQCKYTSKITDFFDLGFGICGKALSSLYAISQVTVTKSERDDLVKIYSFDSNGNLTSSRVSHVNVGYSETLKMDDAELSVSLTPKKGFASQMAADDVEIGVCDEAVFRIQSRRDYPANCNSARKIFHQLKFVV